MADTNVETTQLEQEFERLLKEVGEVMEQLDALAEKISWLNIYEKRAEFEDLRTQEDTLYDKKRDLYGKIDYIQEKLFFLKPPIKSNGVIELRRVVDGRHNDICGNYMITLANQQEVIGKIDYRGYHISPYLGDVGYDIDPDYRGNHYSYHALCLLGEHLKENGIDDFWISAYNDNIPSIKTIERYGGVALNKGEESFTLYAAQTYIMDKPNEKVMN